MAFEVFYHALYLETGLLTPDSTKGPAWKDLRTTFNPSFRGSHLTSLVPEMVEEAMVFVNLMANHAKDGTTLLLEDAVLNCFMDMSGRIFMYVILGDPKVEPLCSLVFLL